MLAFREAAGNPKEIIINAVTMALNVAGVLGTYRVFRIFYAMGRKEKLLQLQEALQLDDNTLVRYKILFLIIYVAAALLAAYEAVIVVGVKSSNFLS